MLQLLRAFAADERGQDLVEYALLTAFVAFTGAAAWGVVQASIGGAYGNWGVSINNLWESPDP